MNYIRKQVKQFSENISDQMVEQEDFAHIPEYESSDSPKIRMAPSPPNAQRKHD